MRCFETSGKPLQTLPRQADRGVFVGGEERQQRLGEARQVPERNPRLIPEGIATAMIDRAEFLVGIILVEECARSVVNRLAGNGRVVGVHHAVHEADSEPQRDEVRLRVHHALE
jgi:hypothetical protein